MGAFVGRTALRNGKGVMVDWRYAEGQNYLPSDEVSRHALRCEARYFALPCLEGLLEAPNGSFADVYAQQSSQLDAYIAAQPFQVGKGVCWGPPGRWQWQQQSR